MDTRTRILASLFGAVLLYALVSSVVYPKWIEPMLNIDERIAKRQEEFDRLDKLDQEVDRAKVEYRAMVARIGSFEPTKAETEIRAHLNELIEKHKLQDANVAPSRPNEDRKTGITRMQVTITALGKLRHVVSFLKDVSEMPHLVRTGNAAVYPASGARKGQSRDRINLRLPLEILVLPQQRLVGRIEEDELSHPETFPPRHQGRDYAMLWTNKPFTEPIPLKANAGPPVNRREGQSARLTGTATGGEPPYACLWTPSDKLKNPDKCKTEVDASVAFEGTYTLTVTDDEGETATATVAVNISEKPVQRGPDPTPSETVVRETGPRRWKDARNMKLSMTMVRKMGDERIGEVMVENNKAKNTQYFAIGDDFHGGKLVFVHPRGAVVRRKDAYVLFPVGGWLDDEIAADAESATVHYPDLKQVADKIRDAEQAKTNGADATGSGPGQAASGPKTAPAKGEASQPADAAFVRSAREDKDKDQQATSAKKTAPGARERSAPKRRAPTTKRTNRKPKLKRTRP